MVPRSAYILIRPISPGAPFLFGIGRRGDLEIRCVLGSVGRAASLADVHWHASGDVVLMTLLGGLGTILGPVADALTIVGLENVLADKVGSWVRVIMGSIFVVPKFMVNGDGSLGARNDAWCVSIEHKLGIKASPTAVLQFGDHGGADGFLVGEENRGLEYMFIMMNAARFAVGMQGVTISDRAYQKTVVFANDRTQSRDLAGSPGPVAIIHHPDVRRMLLTMRATTEGARALAYVAAAASDAAHVSPDAAMRKQNQLVYEYLVPVVKGFSAEMSIDVASLGVQVYGGMGYIEETGAAKYFRDARILTIYEGTTAIQANDFVGRKTVRDAPRFGGRSPRA